MWHKYSEWPLGCSSQTPKPTNPMIIVSSVYFVLMLLISFTGDAADTLLLQLGGMYPAMGFLAWTCIALAGRTIGLWRAEGLIARPGLAALLWTVGAWLPSSVQYGTAEQGLVLGLSLAWWGACGGAIGLVIFFIRHKFGWLDDQED